MVLAGRLAGGHQLTSEQYKIHTPVLSGDFAYWRELDDLWAKPGTLVNVEHDMEFSDDLVRGLVECPHPLCTYPYRCYLRDLGHYVWTPTVDGAWCEEGTEWADTSTLGFVKIAESARSERLRRIIWKYLEHSVCTAVTGLSQPAPDQGRQRAWHVHWPEVQHHHNYDAEAWDRASAWERFCEENGEPCLVWPSQVRDVRSLGLTEANRRRQVARFGG